MPATLRGLTASRKCEARSTLQRRLSSTLNFAWSLGLGAKRAFCGIQATSNTFSDFKVKIVGKRFNEQLCPRPCLSLSMHFYAYAGLVKTPGMAKTAPSCGRRTRLRPCVPCVNFTTSTSPSIVDLQLAQSDFGQQI
jgi:hypothetical protein